jgi:GDPmannose 4,6-dehydratase
MKKAIITGITGQDGSYLAELLLDKGYEVHGINRRSSLSNLERILPIITNIQYDNQFFLHQADLSDPFSIRTVISKSRPHEFYNLAAMSHVGTSFKMPEYSADVNGLGVLRILEAIKEIDPAIRFYQASTSELFGKVVETPQNEKTPFYPRSPYGIAKLFGYWTTVNYREAYHLFACNGILFNHESPRRGEDFVSRKITKGAVRIKLGLQDKISLGNLNAKRDWGFAKDYVEGMWLMLQQPKAEDFVLASGKTFDVRTFATLAFKEIGYNLRWEGKGVEEKGIDVKTGKVVIEVSPEFFREAEVDLLIGDASKAEQKLGWKAKTSLEELVKIMVHSDFAKEKQISKDKFYEEPTPILSSKNLRELVEKKVFAS